MEDRRLLSVFTVSNLSDGPVAKAGDLPGSLRQAIFDANANPGADTIQFSPGLTGVIKLSAGELAITDALTIQGPGATNLTIDGAQASLIFYVSDNISGSNYNVQFTGLTLTGGSASGQGFHFAGGAIYSTESLTVSHCTITGNHGNGGGGISTTTSGSGHTLIEDSIFSDDHSLGGGGIRRNHQRQRRRRPFKTVSSSATARMKAAASKPRLPAAEQRLLKTARFSATVPSGGGGISTSSSARLDHHPK